MNCKPFGATANWNNTLPIFNCRYMFSHEFDIFAKMSQNYSPYEVIDNKAYSCGINNQSQPNFNSKSLSCVLRDPTHISGFNKFNDNFCNDSAACRGYKNDVVSSRLLSYEHQPKQIQKPVTVKVNVIKRNYQVPQYSSQNMGCTTNSSPLNISDFICKQSRSLPSPTPNLVETSCEKLESCNIQTQLMNALSPKEIVENEKVKNSDILCDFSQRETSPDNIHELALKTTSELSEENCDFICDFKQKRKPKANNERTDIIAKCLIRSIKRYYSVLCDVQDKAIYSKETERFEECLNKIDEICKIQFADDFSQDIIQNSLPLCQLIKVKGNPYSGRSDEECEFIQVKIMIICMVLRNCTKNILNKFDMKRTFLNFYDCIYKYSQRKLARLIKAPAFKRTFNYFINSGELKKMIETDSSLHFKKDLILKKADDIQRFYLLK